MTVADLFRRIRLGEDSTLELKHVSPSGDRFDESVVPRTLPEHLDEELTRRFLREDAELTEDTLHKLGIVAADEEDVVRLTLAGVLLCTREPQQWMPHASPIIRAECQQLAGRLPEYSLIDDSELRLVIWAA